jgi:hypothetical protein
MHSEHSSPFAISHTLEPRLGVDIGRVIIHGDGPDTSFVGGSAEDALSAPAVDGALAALARLQLRLAGRVWLVSKCGPKVQSRTMAWFDHHRFFESTGLSRERVRFCRDRRDKAPICKELGIGLFVDDRRDVLEAMSGVVPYRFLFGAESASANLVPVLDWREAEAAILETINRLEPERSETAGEQTR